MGKKRRPLDRKAAFVCIYGYRKRTALSGGPLYFTSRFRPGPLPFLFFPCWQGPIPMPAAEEKA